MLKIVFSEKKIIYIYKPNSTYINYATSNFFKWQIGFVSEVK